MWTRKNYRKKPRTCPECRSPYWEVPKGSPVYPDTRGKPEPRCKCQVCSWEWIRRKIRAFPVRCPRCFSLNWRKHTPVTLSMEEARHKAGLDLTREEVMTSGRPRPVPGSGQ